MVAEAVRRVEAEGREVQEPCEQRDRGRWGREGGRVTARGHCRLHPGSIPKPGWLIHLAPLKTTSDDECLPSCITVNAAFPKLRFPTASDS